MTTHQYKLTNSFFFFTQPVKTATWTVIFAVLSVVCLWLPFNEFLHILLWFLYVLFTPVWEWGLRFLLLPIKLPLRLRALRAAQAIPPPRYSNVPDPLDDNFVHSQPSSSRATQNSGGEGKFKIIKVKIPRNAEAGETFEFITPDGQRATGTVPPNKNRQRILEMKVRVEPQQQQQQQLRSRGSWRSRGVSKQVSMNTASWFESEVTTTEAAAYDANARRIIEPLLQRRLLLRPAKIKQIRQQKSS